MHVSNKEEESNEIKLKLFIVTYTDENNKIDTIRLRIESEKDIESIFRLWMGSSYQIVKFMEAE